eukprot:Opistho-2@86222
MEGVFLHVLADTLGSVGVMISSFLMYQFGWMMADPICSMCLSLMIFVSVIPLLRESASVLLQRSPKELDDKLPGCLEKISRIDGVVGHHNPHFWTLSSGFHIGTLCVVTRPDADNARILGLVQSIFKHAGVTEMVVQLERQNANLVY